MSHSVFKNSKTLKCLIYITFTSNTTQNVSIIIQCYMKWKWHVWSMSTESETSYSDVLKNQSFSNKNGAVGNILYNVLETN